MEKLATIVGVAMITAAKVEAKVEALQSILDLNDEQKRLIKERSKELYKSKIEACRSTLGDELADQWLTVAELQ